MKIYACHDERMRETASLKQVSLKTLFDPQRALSSFILEVSTRDLTVPQPSTMPSPSLDTNGLDPHPPRTGLSRTAGKSVRVIRTCYDLYLLPYLTPPPLSVILSSGAVLGEKAVTSESR